ncbi:MAG: glycosyltransferase, partial [Bacteroidota bacterium]
TPPFLHRVARAVEPAVIHAHFGISGFRLLGLKRRHRIPLLTQFYGFDVLQLPGEAGWTRRYRTLAREGDCFIAITEEMKRDLVAQGFPEAKIDVVKLAIDTEAMRFTPRRQPESTLRLIAVGRLVEKKGFAYAIEAVQALQSQGREVSLDVFGDGPLRAELEAKASISKGIKFHGRAENATILDALQRHDALLVPSVLAGNADKEGMPQIIVEAMASGLPVIASRHSGIPEIVIDGETGLLHDERDDAGLTRALGALADTPELAERFSHAGRQFVETHHDIRGMVERLETIYDRIATFGL